MPAISGLGHVGLYCSDLALQESFYTEVLGLTKTDEDQERGMVFLSSQPDVEHHELLLLRGRNVGQEARVVQQVSFRCPSLADVTSFHRRFRERSVKVDMVVSHGNAIGVYFYDPEGNRGEIYCATGLVARQPFLQPVNLDDEPDEIMRAVAQGVEQFGETGVLDTSALAQHNITAAP
jgi:catechol-2,3-dioxygenase